MSAIEKAERAVIYTPEPGDVVVLEVPREMSSKEVDEFQAGASDAFGMDVQVVVLVQAHLAAVIRKGDQ